MPSGVHEYCISCSCINTGWPFGGSLDILLNWPLKNTPHVHHVWFTEFNFNGSIGIGNNDFRLFHSIPPLAGSLDEIAINPKLNKQQKYIKAASNFMISRCGVLHSIGKWCESLLCDTPNSRLKLISKCFKQVNLNDFQTFPILIWIHVMLWLQWNYLGQWMCKQQFNQTYDTFFCSMKIAHLAIFTTWTFFVAYFYRRHINCFYFRSKVQRNE